MNEPMGHRGYAASARTTHFSEALGVFFSSPLAKGPSAASFMKLTRTSALTPESGFPRSFRMEACSRKYTYENDSRV